jgi:hypothetical protein
MLLVTISQAAFLYWQNFANLKIKIKILSENKNSKNHHISNII